MTSPITVNQTCVVCSKTEPSNPLETACHHIFCRDCFILSQASQADDSCTLCGRATQISLHSLLDADINTMVTQHTDLQTRIDDLYAQNLSTTTMIRDNVVRNVGNPLNQRKRTLDTLQAMNCLLTGLTQLANLENVHRQVQSDIEALQRISRKPSPFDSTPPIVNLPPLQLLTVAFNSTRLIASLISNALQRTPQPLSTYQPTRQAVSDIIMNQGKTVLIQQKQIQDATMLLQTALTAIAEKLENINTNP